MPVGFVFGQTDNRKLIETHHHFYPPAYQKAWPGLWFACGVGTSLSSAAIAGELVEFAVS